MLHSQTKKHIFSTLKFTFLFAVLFFGVHFLSAAFVEPGVGPQGNNVGPINVSSTTQVKEGQLGIGGTPPTGVDLFITNGPALFTGGVIASSADFEKDVIVGSNSSGPSNVFVHGDVVVPGNGATIINDALQHTNNTPQPVCSTDDGTLTLCGTTPNPPSCTPINNAPTGCAFIDNPGASFPDNTQCNAVANTSGQRITHFQVQAENGPGVVGWSTVHTDTSGTNPMPGPLGTHKYQWNNGSQNLESWGRFRMRAIDGQCTSPWSAPFGPGGGNQNNQGNF